MSGDPGPLRDRMAAIVGDAQVLDDPELTAGYCRDWTGRFEGHTPLVVRPGSTDEVAAVLRVCAEAGVAVVPQGGNTGLVAGGIPRHGEVVLSLRRLDTIEDVDDAVGQLTAGAGATIGAVQTVARGCGWDYGVDLASRDSATVGGTIATNAGGLHVLRHGDTRAQVLGVEAVLGDGSVIGDLRGLLRDNTGYHLPKLLAGSEGTLGVITRARLRLVPPTPQRVVALLACADVASAVATAARVRRTLDCLSAAELMLAPGVDLVCRVHGLAPPFTGPAPAYLLVEVADQTDPLPALEQALNAVPGVLDVAVATDPSRCAALWRYREAHTESINTVGAPHKLDVALPLSRLAEFIARVEPAVHERYPQAAVWLFGHAADGNVHVNVTGVAADDDGVDDLVLRLVVAMDGSISAEHGIGTAKLAWFALARRAEEHAAFERIRRAMDPAGILNPHVLRLP